MDRDTVPARGRADAGFECLLEPWQVVFIHASVDGVMASVALAAATPSR